MPRFSYLARDGGGAALTGELTAGSPAEAARLLRAEGKFAVRVREAADQPEVDVNITIGRRRIHPTWCHDREMAGRLDVIMHFPALAPTISRWHNWLCIMVQPCVRVG